MLDLHGWRRKSGVALLRSAARPYFTSDRTYSALRRHAISTFGLPCGFFDGMRCAACGSDLPSGSRFCGQCGSPAARERFAERRQITVMFCDLVGSTALSARTDPEDLRDLLRHYQHAAAQAIEAQGGHVAQYLGDGLMAYFGYPQAQEDDPIRAVRAALNVVRNVSAISADLQRRYASEVRVRVGLHTGLVVAGEMGGGKHRETGSAVGETPNLAARLQALAQPDQVVISQTTRRLVDGFFTIEYLGQHELKGIEAPQDLWRVIVETSAPNRVEAVGENSLTPFVGREAEIQYLRERRQAAEQGNGQVVLLCAEPGVGKSRLIATFLQSTGSSSEAAVRYFCSPHHQSSPLHPVLSYFERAAGIGFGEGHETSQDKLAAFLRGAGLSSDEVSLITAFAVPHGIHRSLSASSPPPMNMKERVRTALLKHLELAFGDRTATIVFEDIHWIDATSLDFLDALVRATARRKVLLIVSFRPEAPPRWLECSHVGVLQLNRMTDVETRRLLGALASGRFDEHTTSAILNRAEGVPLFAEELAKTILDSKVAGLIQASESLIPTTLHASLTARLDRLGPSARQLAQTASAIGREFDLRILRVAAELQTHELEDSLSRLIRAGVLTERGALCAFSHALVQDAAYLSMVREHKRAVHGRIADLARAAPDLLTRSPEIVAFHAEAADRHEMAVDLWQRAGELALRRSSVAEARNHLHRAVALIEAHPTRQDHVRTERSIRLQLGLALQLLHGPAGQECHEQYAKAESLSSALPLDRESFIATWGSWLHFNVRGLVTPGLEKTEQMLRAANELGDPDLLLEAHHARLPLLTFKGEGPALRRAVAEVLRRYDPKRHSEHAHMFGGHDSLVCARSFDSIALWLAGDFEHAFAEARAATQYAKALNHPFSVAHSYAQSGLTFILLRDHQACREAAIEISAIAERHHFAWPLAFGRFLHGWLIAQTPEQASGIEKMHSAADHPNASNRRAWMLALIAEAEIKAGRLDKARDAVKASQRVAQELGARLFQAENARIAGELALRDGNDKEAEQHFLEAVAVARAQSAVGFELRAATSLARLWREGKPHEARRVLATIYHPLCKGFDTADLADARELLESIGG